jgi:hypothetical protein
MRTFRLCLVAAVVAALGMVAIPVASATTGYTAISKFEKKQNKRIKKAKNNISDLQDKTDALDSKNDAQDTSLNDLDGVVDSLVAAVPTVLDTLTQLADGLTAVNTALQDPVTGLVGLNNARPQFAAFGDGGGLIASTGTAGGKGPNDDATALGNGAYVVDFNNDVGHRFLTVNVTPDAGGAMYTGQAVSCQSATTTCDAASVPVADYDENVLVTIQGQPGGPGTAVVPSNPVGGSFSVAAFSG